VELRRYHLETLHRAEHRNGRRYDAVAVQKGGADEAENDDYLFAHLVLGALLLLKNQCEESEDASFPAIVGAQDEDQILDADDENERPYDERQNSIDILGDRGESVFRLEALLKRVKRTRADIAVYDAERYES
jgi:hypothetical protein